MFTYGYIREATMAHLDIDEDEAQAMNLLSRFHIYANEAMQAICASKPMYQYIDITVVEKFAPLVMDGAIFRTATREEIDWDEEIQGDRPFKLVNETQMKAYYHERNIYEQFENLMRKAGCYFVNPVEKEKLQNYEQKLEVKNVGTVLEVADGISRVYGLSGYINIERNVRCSYAQKANHCPDVRF